MTGDFYIDGIDMYTEYGMYLANGCYAELLAWPSFKDSSIPSHDWHETNGLDIDLTSPVFGGRTVKLTLYIGHRDTASVAQKVFKMLETGVSHTFLFPRLGLQYTLRLEKNSDFKYYYNLDKVTIQLALDSVTFPAMGASVTIPTHPSQTVTVGFLPLPSVNYLTDYRIDGKDFSQFAMYVTKGTAETFMKCGDVKEALKRDISVVNGLLYDTGDTVRTKSKDITLNLHLRTADIATFWRLWYALAATVTASGERTVEGSGFVYKCYYKQHAVQRFVITDDGSVWCDSALKFAVLRSEKLQLLGTGDSEAIVDNNNIAIGIQ